MAVGEQTPLGQLRLKARFLGLEHMLRSDEELAEISAAADRARIGTMPAEPRPFAVGDIVKLKSGGHRMVVEELRCARLVHVYWSERGTIEGQDLPEQCLRLCVPGELNDISDDIRF